MSKQLRAMYGKAFFTLLFLIGASSQFHSKFLHKKLTSVSKDGSKFDVDPPSISSRCLSDWVNKQDQLLQCENYYLEKYNDEFNHANSIQEIENLICSHILNVQGCFNILTVSIMMFFRLISLAHISLFNILFEQACSKADMEAIHGFIHENIMHQLSDSGMNCTGYNTPSGSTPTTSIPSSSTTSSLGLCLYLCYAIFISSKKILDLYF